MHSYDCCASNWILRLRAVRRCWGKICNNAALYAGTRSNYFISFSSLPLMWFLNKSPSVVFKPLSVVFFFLVLAAVLLAVDLLVVDFAVDFLGAAFASFALIESVTACVFLSIPII